MTAENSFVGSRPDDGAGKHNNDPKKWQRSRYQQLLEAYVFDVNGSLTTNRVPLPLADSASMCPLCAVMIP
jgi:hypothetical protein